MVFIHTGTGISWATCTKCVIPPRGVTVRISAWGPFCVTQLGLRCFTFRASYPKRRLSCSLFSWGYLFLFLTFFFLYKFLPFLFTSTCHLCTHTFKSFCLTFRPDYFELPYQELVAFVFWFILELFTNNHNSWEWLDGILWEYCLKL